MLPTFWEKTFYGGVFFQIPHLIDVTKFVADPFEGCG